MIRLSQLANAIAIEIPPASADSCGQEGFIESYLAHRLTSDQQAEFELHLFACQGCLRMVEFELRVRQLAMDFAKSTQISRSWH